MVEELKHISSAILSFIIYLQLRACNRHVYALHVSHCIPCQYTSRIGCQHGTSTPQNAIPSNAWWSLAISTAPLQSSTIPLEMEVKV